MPVSPRQARYLDALGVMRYARRVADGIVPDASVAAPTVAVLAETSQPFTAPAASTQALAATPVASHPAVSTLPPADPALAWPRLIAQIAACTACGLSRTRTNTVPGVGDPRADWLIVGEAPGADEDATGEPFVGRAGKLLDAMLRAVGLSRQRGVYITNIVKCRPPDNRDPAPDEAGACAGYLERQIALIHPKLILAVGKVAAHNLLGTEEPMNRLRGKVWQWRGTDLPVVVTYHPAYLLRSPLEKRKSWDDLCLAQDVYRQRSGQPA
ncbi:MAG: uracil-DNA glycosylase [Immundisolibacter sp.]|uniref:uracil-DNA glycosylase n=1 Tax=Immundisolibacter sp. TaxID=1934948 RepID=UPI0019A6AB27|nr:uracil-DNA glycosylase [Immundisolibacter sp.]MBC7162508.1 uracil-DNA glycosylase [Immundisolibacter sp.]